MLDMKKKEKITVVLKDENGEDGDRIHYSPSSSPLGYQSSIPTCPPCRDLWEKILLLLHLYKKSLLFVSFKHNINIFTLVRTIKNINSIKVNR